LNPEGVCQPSNPFRVGRDFKINVPGLSLRSNPGLELANAFGVKPELELANDFGVFKPVLLTFHVDPTFPRYGTDLIQPEAADPESMEAIC